MKRLNILLVIFLFTVLTQSCRKDIDDLEIISPNIPTVIKVISSLHGNVVDALGNGISGATVTFENETVQTDENGVFKFINTPMNKNGTFISVEKEGYFRGSRRLYPSVGNTSIVNIELIPLIFVDDFISGSGATINHDGIRLDFPQDAIVYEDGSAFTGKVKVAVAYLDPTDPETLDQMPGDLTGISTEDGLVALRSLGMIAVELRDDNDIELQVKSGKLVDVSIPIPSALQSDAPATIPMWHFDEEMGIWIEEGFADLVGDHYETSLAHFSFWNCDVPSDFVFIKGSILNRGIPIQGITVMILDPSSNTSGYGITDENGWFCGFVPNNETLTLVIYNQCGNEIYSTAFTTTDVDTFLDPINLNLLVDYATISGTASSCAGDLSEYAYVIVQDGIQNYTFPVSQDGTFMGNIFYCNQAESITVLGFDPIEGLVSGEYIFEIEGDFIVGNIELCDQTFVEHIIVAYDDIKFNLSREDIPWIIFNFGDNPITGNDATEGFIIKTIYEPEPDSTHLFKFFINYLEGSPFQESRVEHIDTTVSPTGVGASGLCSSQLVTQEGIEYYKASGILSNPSGLNGQTSAQIYFDILLKNQ